MKRRVAARGLGIALLLGFAAPSATQQEEEPRDVGLREEAERQLIQLDVTVTGPADAIADLTADDFDLVVKSRRVTEITVDRVCRELLAVPGSATEPEAETATTVAAAPDDPPAPLPPPIPPVTYLFYFDQEFLTVEGRNNGLATAHTLIDELVRGGDRATVVSSGRVVTTYADLTTDAAKLHEALDQVEEDPEQWDPTVFSDEARIDQVLRRLNERGADEAASLARLFQSEERWRTEKALRRFSMVMGRMADLPSPKVVVYFADRMRSNPGEFYTSYFNLVQQRRSAALSRIETDSFTARASFDAVVNEANAHGARLYAIQAEGMTGLGTVASRQPANNTGGTRHITDAQNSLVSLARETGGQPFLRGIKATKIATAIREDMACVYLVSFDAAGFPKNEPLPVRLKSTRPKVEARTRGQIFIQSDSKRLTSRLMAAFTAPDAVRSDVGIRASLIPTGFDSGKYSALVQLSLEGSPLPDVTWDMGISALARDKVREDVNGRISVSGAGTPVVFESLLTFPPGPYEIVMVAHDASTDQVATTKFEGEWPDPDEIPASVAPIAVVQPATALFVRDGQVKGSGALGHAADQPRMLSTDLPTVMITLVCRSKKLKGQLRVERRLVGASSAAFPSMDLALGEDRCAQIRDMVNPDTMTSGNFTYEVQVFAEDTELITGRQAFDALDPEDAGGAAATDDAGP